MNTDTNKFKYVVGSAEKERPAVIRFFGPVDSYAVRDFIDEFKWLQSQQPSKIVVLINSEGGSVVQGMSVYSVIQTCPIETDCVVEGVAASMGSVIWAAGDNRYIHDYSILMIHNPFICGAEEEDVDARNMTQAFKSQLETIYTKRFGFAKDKVRQIMDGADGADGTWFDSKAAVEAGLVDKANVIKSSKKKQDFIQAQIKGLGTCKEISAALLLQPIEGTVDEAVMSAVMSDAEAAAEEQNDNNQTTIINKQMAETKDKSYELIVAQLGLDSDAPIASVNSKIKQLNDAEKSLSETKASLEALQIKFAGKETEVANLQAKLEEVENSLNAYRKAEQEAKEAAIEKMVDAAIADGKIGEAAKASWIEMAKANFDLTKDTLDSISAREKISEEIANDKQNQEKAVSAITEAEELVKAAIDKTVGKDFTLMKF